MKQESNHTDEIFSALKQEFSMTSEEKYRVLQNAMQRKQSPAPVPWYQRAVHMMPIVASVAVICFVIGIFALRPPEVPSRTTQTPSDIDVVTSLPVTLPNITTVTIAQSGMVTKPQTIATEETIPVQQTVAITTEMPVITDQMIVTSPIVTQTLALTTAAPVTTAVGTTAATTADTTVFTTTTTENTVGTIVLRSQDMEVKAGEQVTVRVYHDTDTSYGGCQIWIVADNANDPAEYLDVIGYTLFDNPSIHEANNQYCLILKQFNQNKTFSKNSTFCEITFQIPDDAAVGTEYNLELYYSAENKVVEYWSGDDLEKDVKLGSLKVVG